MLKKNWIIAIYLLISFSVKAQLTHADKLAEFYKTISVEKIHLHFDKEIYTLYDDIFFKAYIISGTEPSTLSTNLYVNWYAENGVLIDKQVFPIYYGAALGSYKLPASLKSEKVTAIAYTSLMLNYDADFFYKKELKVFNPQLKKSKSISKNENSNSIHFFPEGGQLVDSVQTNIAFKIENITNKYAEIKGVILNKKNDSIASFKTEYNGMGSFYFLPIINEDYVAEWKDEQNILHRDKLPNVSANDIALNVVTNENGVTFFIKRNSKEVGENRNAKIVGFSQQQILYSAKILMPNKDVVTGFIPTKDFPSGIFQLTIFNYDDIPVAERIIFINNKEYIKKVSVQKATVNLSQRGFNEMELETDSVTLASYSVSVTDADIVEKSEQNIFTSLLLQGDLRGEINDATHYFNDEDSIKRHLDLLMLTQGWRRYNWSDIVAPLQKQIIQRDSSYLTISGKLKNFKPFKKNKPDVVATFIEATDSSRTILLLPLDDLGYFKKEGFIFYDSIKVLIKDSKLKYNHEGFELYSNLNNEKSKHLINLKWSSKIKDSIYNAALQNINDAQYDFFKKQGWNELESVTVTSKTKSREEFLDEKYTNGMFSGDGKIFDVSNDPRGASSFSVFTYLQGQVAGLQISTNNLFSTPTLTWRNAATTLFLNEMQVDASWLQSISMNDVDLIKVFRPPFFGAFGGGSGGAIAVYTKKGGDGNYEPIFNYEVLKGYNSVKQFYSPNYANIKSSTNIKDVRTTLYWNPAINTDDENKNIKFSFYNNDFSKKLRIVVEGMDYLGKLVHFEKIIE